MLHLRYNLFVPVAVSRQELCTISSDYCILIWCGMNVVLIRLLLLVFSFLLCLDVVDRLLPSLGLSRHRNRSFNYIATFRQWVLPTAPFPDHREGQYAAKAV